MFVLLGFALMRTLVPGGRRLCRHDFWRALVGSGLGVGIVSVVFVASLVTRTSELAVEAALLALFAWFAWHSPVCRFCTNAPQPWDLLDRLLAVAFGLALTCAAVLFLRETNIAPHGEWDAWAIHNLHARFLNRSSVWRDLFTPVLTWSHPDYPLVIPGFIASCWRFLGKERTAVPAATAFLFTFGTAGLLSSSLALLRDRRQGLLAGLVLLGAPYFVTIGAWQFVDVPLGWFLLAAIVLLVMDYPAAAGLAASFCASTKNEGVLLVAAVVIGWALARQWTVRRLRGFALGALVPLAMLVWFKLTVAPPNPLVSSANALQHLTDLSRYGTILEGFARHLWTFGGLFASPFLFLAGYAALMGIDATHRGAARAVALTLVLAACGEGAVYMFATQNPVVQLIDESLGRLLVQMWPTAVFLLFLAARPIEYGPESPITGPAQPVVSKIRRFSLPLLVLSGLILYVSFGRNASQGEDVQGSAPAPGVTQNLLPGHAEVLYSIDLVGPVTAPTGKTVRASASRPLAVAGWAVAPASKQLAANVDVVIDGVPYAARYGIARPDVAAYLKDKVYEKSGFQFFMPANELAKGSHMVFVRIVDSDGKSFVQSPGITVILE